MFERYLTQNSLLIPICVLAIGLLPLPTPFYTGVKWIVFIFGGMIFLTVPSIRQKEKMTMLALAIIYNPIYPIYFGTRLIWWPINAVALFAFWKFRSNLIEDGEILQAETESNNDVLKIGSTKTQCPFCAEEIRPLAKKCKHCGEWLQTS